MRVHSTLARLFAASAVLTASVWAEEAESSSTSAAASSSTAAAKKPDFTPSDLKAPFLEQFTDDWESRWTVSKAKKDDPKSEEDWAYVGEWAVEEPTVYKGIEGDKGLVVKNPAAHHAISAKFPKAIDNKGKTLVVQYEVKLQNGLECGGAYMKLLQDNKKLHAEEFANSSPYIIMFGPDKCGATNKVHLIIRHKNPKSGEYEEKHLKMPPLAKIESTTQLYTLMINPNQTYDVRINGASQKSGSLLEDFDPPFNPAKEIDDADDKKPDDWVDTAKIEDPAAKKPADWDEDAPFEVVDDEATKPDDWLEDEPASVPDPEAEKPEDWDDEEDGDWIPPTVPNPKCNDASGCGKWEKPTKRNPDYKGKWKAPMVDNPAYKGPWAPRKIKNPNFFEDKTPANLEPMGAIGFEIWTMQKDILFDNIYIGHSPADAEKLKAETYDVKIGVESAAKDKDKPKDADKPASPSDLKFMDDPVTYVKEKFQLFVTIAQRDPLEAVRFVPEIAGGIGVVVATFVVAILSMFMMGGGQPPESVKKAADAAKDKAQQATAKGQELADQAKDAAASGAEKVQAEVSKRTTRASAAAQQE